MSIFSKIVTSVFGKKSDKDLKIIQPIVDQINEKYESLSKFSDDELSKFQSQLSDYGYKLQFVSLAGFHSMASAMYELAINYKGGDMKAFVELQEKEIELEKRGYTGTKHQQEVGSNYYDQVGEIILGQDSELLSEKDSTENTQF